MNPSRSQVLRAAIFKVNLGHLWLSDLTMRSLSLPLLILLCLCSPLSSATTVAVSVQPQRYLLEQLADGDWLHVQVMVEAGASPATYTPTVQQIAQLAEAQRYFRVGVPFENGWIERIASANKQMRIIDLRASLELRALEAHHHEDGHHHHDDELAAMDPHIWTDPLNAIQMAEQMHHALRQLAPQHSAELDANLERLRSELNQLHHEISTLLAPLAEQRFLVFHPAWGYFAERYHLHQVAIEAGGKEPGAKALAKIIAQAKQANARLILVQPQFSQRAAQQVANAIGAQLVNADPLALDYSNNLRQLAQLLAEKGLHQ